MFDRQTNEYTFSSPSQGNYTEKLRRLHIDIIDSEPVRSIEESGAHVEIAQSLSKNIFNNHCKFFTVDKSVMFNS